MIVQSLTMFGELLGLGLGLYLSIAKLHGLFALALIIAIYKRVQRIRKSIRTWRSDRVLVAP